MKFGIALATYNPNERYLSEQLASIVAQSYKDWMCLILDDGSTREAFEIVKRLAKTDNRFFVLGSQANQGPGRCFMNLIEHFAKETNLEWVALCDQDDIWLPNKLEHFLSLTKKHPDKLIHTDLCLVDKDGNLMSNSCWEFESRELEGVSIEKLIHKNIVTGCASVIPRKLLIQSLPFPEFPREFGILHDHWLACVASLDDGIFSHHSATVLYRQHQGNVVGAGQKVPKKRRPFEVLKKMAQLLKIRAALLTAALERGKVSKRACLVIWALFPIYFLNQLFQIFSIHRKASNRIVTSEGNTHEQN